MVEFGEQINYMAEKIHKIDICIFLFGKVLLGNKPRGTEEYIHRTKTTSLL